ncbi:hypothetical protein OF83DRAFT_35167 [Amylostereum chailletii]|nr:hypothetical protein OF83DRAFT_35167 [Amylostereum chailletii]
MQLTTLLLPSMLAIVARAQYGAPIPAGPATSAAPAAAPTAPANTPGRVNVQVAPGGQFLFSPNNFNASVGTVVTFYFPVGSTANGPHSVTQSSFDAPCTYLAAANGSSGGFDSGLQSAVQFAINITDDTQPIWFHCKQIQHCGEGMVGGINIPTSGNTTFQAFQAAASAIGLNEKTETDNGPVTGGINAVATATPGPNVGSSIGSSNNSNSAAHLGVCGAVVLAVAAGIGMVFV